MAASELGGAHRRVVSRVAEKDRPWLCFVAGQELMELERACGSLEVKVGDGGAESERIGRFGRDFRLCHFVTSVAAHVYLTQKKRMKQGPGMCVHISDWRPGYRWRGSTADDC